MARIALGVEYDGSRYRGWQAQQRGIRSVQVAVESALSKVANEPVSVVCAGRTDAGVHARGQVIHFDTGAERTPRSWVHGANANLPDDISILWAQPVSEEFHARFSARARSYQYLIYNSPVRPALFREQLTWNFRPLDVARMQAGAQHLLGTHDFSSFRGIQCQAKSPVRTLHRLEVQRRGDMVVIEANANAFLMHMVRNIAGVLMAVGSGKQEPEWVAQVLAACDRTQGGVTAPPYGLYMMAVEYEPQLLVVPQLPSPLFERL